MGPGILTAGGSSTISIASGTYNFPYAFIRGINVQGGATFTATNSVDLGNNTGWSSITNPSNGGGGGVIGVIGG
jgi:hypothetical protein